MALADLRRAVALPDVDRRTLAGVGLAAAAALLVLVLTRPAPTVPVLVAAEDLPAGTPLGELAVGVRSVPDAAGLVEGDSLGDLAGWSLAIPVKAGEPLLPSTLRPPALREHPDLLALALEESHAVLGRIAPGDQVDVYVTWPSDTFAERPPTELLASGVYVVESRTASSGFSGGTVELLVAVDDDLAALLTAAIRSGEIDLVKVGS